MKVAVTILSLLFLNSCGSPNQGAAGDFLQLKAPDFSGATSSPPEAPDATNIFNPEVSDAPPSMSLLLAAIPAYSIVVNGCQSGFQSTYTQATKAMKLYKFDRGCLGRLKEFTFNGKVFKPKLGFDFTTYLKGDVATFLSSDHSIQFQVEVARQLSSPVVASDYVDYRFAKIVGSTQNPVLLGIIPGKTGRVEVSCCTPPNFRFAESRMLDEVPAKGAFKLAFTMECSSRLSRTHNRNLVFCGTTGNRLSRIRYVLVNDTFNGVPCTSRNPAACRALFNGSETYVDPHSIDYLEPGCSGLPNGGFRTKIDLKKALVSPDKIGVQSKMILVLANDYSYQFFDLSFKTTVLYLEE